jgi:hypothetical protein
MWIKGMQKAMIRRGLEEVNDALVNIWMPIYRALPKENFLIDAVSIPGSIRGNIVFTTVAVQSG